MGWGEVGGFFHTFIWGSLVLLQWGGGGREAESYWFIMLTEKKSLLLLILFAFHPPSASPPSPCPDLPACFKRGEVEEEVGGWGGGGLPGIAGEILSRRESKH